MSLRSTAVIRSDLTAALGEREAQYWETFHDFIAGQVSQHEFSEAVQTSLNTPHLGLHPFPQVSFGSGAEYVPFSAAA
jgi:hypothetical protein